MNEPIVRVATKLLPFAYRFIGAEFGDQFTTPAELEAVHWASLEPGNTAVYVARPEVSYRPRRLHSRAQAVGLVLEDLRIGACCQFMSVDGSLPICIDDVLDLGDIDTCVPGRNISARVRNASDVAIKFKLWFSGRVAY